MNSSPRPEDDPDQGVDLQDEHSAPPPDAIPAATSAATPATRELETITLGSSSGEERAPKARVVPGRVSLTAFGWIMSATLLGAGAAMLAFALLTSEWALPVVALAWLLIWLWKWLYMVAWTYQRALLKWVSAMMCVAMSVAVAWLCHDRAAAQPIWDHAQSAMITRAPRHELELAAALFSLGALVLLSHLAWFGRGWRLKHQRIGSS